MSKRTLLIVLVVGLLISNLALATFIFLHKPPKEGGPRNIVIEKLGLDAQQIKEYDVLIQQHRDAIRKKDGEIRQLKDQLYQQLFRDQNAPQVAPQKAPSMVADSLIGALGKVQMDIEKVHYQHFESLRKLCRPDQQQAFTGLVHEIAIIFAQSKRPQQK